MIIPRGIGFPHSDISGSLLTYCSPKPFVVRHVLHRLLVPRHSPCALFYLTYFKLSFSLFSVALQSVFFDCLGFLLLIIFSFQCTNPWDFMSQWRLTGSNRWPPACKAGALPSELSPHHCLLSKLFLLWMGLNGLEPSTSRLSGVRSNQLSYKPIYASSRIRNDYSSIPYFSYFCKHFSEKT